MSDEISVSPSDLESQIKTLIARYQRLKSENAALKQKVLQLERENTELTTQLNNLNADYIRLKIAKAYGWNEQSKREANDRLLKLVREIDRCLKLLNE